MGIDAMGAELALPLERPLFALNPKPRLAELQIVATEDEVDTTGLFGHVVVDKARLRATVQRALRREPQVTLRALLDAEPLHQGLAELVAYLELAHAGTGNLGADRVRALVDDAVEESIQWHGSDPAGESVLREAHMPRVIFTR